MVPSLEKPVHRVWELLMGWYLDHEDREVVIPSAQVAFHTAILAQSGAGKSSVLGRLVEEILLCTSARVVVLDANGDFRRFREFNDSAWLDTPTGSGQWPRLPWEGAHAAREFKDLWVDGIRQVHLPADMGVSSPHSPRQKQHSLVRFASLDVHVQGAILEWALDYGHAPLHELARSLRLAQADRPEVVWEASPVVLGFLSRIGEQLDLLSALGTSVIPRPSEAAEADIQPGEVETPTHPQSSVNEVKGDSAPGASGSEGPTTGGGLAQERARSKRDVEKLRGQLEKWRIWAPEEGGEDLADWICRPKVAWDAFVLDLLSIPERPARQVVAGVALESLWADAIHRWELAASAKHSDTRVPTFIVVDEAHNFAPRAADDPFTERTASLLATIAAEGRKYGVFLILATQRPAKVRDGLLAECENVCLLRLQSPVDHAMVSETWGIPIEDARRTRHFRTGDGLLFGRWVPGATPFHAALRRTAEGGASLRAEHWCAARGAGALKAPAPSESE